MKGLKPVTLTWRPESLRHKVYDKVYHKPIFRLLIITCKQILNTFLLIELACLHVACVIAQKDCKQWFAELNTDLDKVFTLVRLNHEQRLIGNLHLVGFGDNSIHIEFVWNVEELWRKKGNSRFVCSLPPSLFHRCARWRAGESNYLTCFQIGQDAQAEAATIEVTASAPFLLVWTNSLIGMCVDV